MVLPGFGVDATVICKAVEFVETLQRVARQRYQVAVVMPVEG